MVIVMSMMGNHADQIDVNFGEPMGKFMTAVLAEVRRANAVSV
jgi:hypothetical protein